MADFIPKGDPELVSWLTNFKAKIAIHGPTLGLAAAKVTQLQGDCDALIAAIQLVPQKKNDWQAAVTTKGTLKTSKLGALRGDLNAFKANPALTPAMADDLEIVGTPTAFDPNTFKTQLTVELVAGHVRIKFIKGATDGVNLYTRLKGQSAWQFLARDTNSPYGDFRPLAAAGVAEVREYQAFGVVDDEQIGQASDIVSITFAG